MTGRLAQVVASTGTFILAALAITWTVINVVDAVHLSNRAPTLPFRVAEDWRGFIPVGQVLYPARRSSASAAIHIFVDYECASCRKLLTSLAALEEGRAATPGVIIHQLPLDIHPHAMAAALAAVCAGVEGRFAAFHSLLVADERSVSRGAWIVLASHAGIRDTVHFTKCLTSPETAVTVAADIQAGVRLAAHATPIILAGNEVYLGVPWDWKRIVQAEQSKPR